MEEYCRVVVEKSFLAFKPVDGTLQYKGRASSEPPGFKPEICLANEDKANITDIKEATSVSGTSASGPSSCDRRKERKLSKAERDKIRKRKAATRVQAVWRGKQARRLFVVAHRIFQRTLAQDVVRRALLQYVNKEYFLAWRQVTKARNRAVCRVIVRAVLLTVSIEDFAQSLHERLTFRTRSPHIQAWHGRGANAMQAIVRISLLLVSQVHVVQSYATFGSLVISLFGLSLELYAMALSSSTVQFAIVGQRVPAMVTMVVLMHVLTHLIGLQLPAHFQFDPSTSWQSPPDDPPDASTGGGSGHFSLSSSEQPENSSHQSSTCNKSKSNAASHSTSASSLETKPKANFFHTSAAALPFPSESLDGQLSIGSDATSLKASNACARDDHLGQAHCRRESENTGYYNGPRTRSSSQYQGVCASASIAEQDVDCGIPLHATLIGNSEYRNDLHCLSGSCNDVRGLGMGLAALGFECHSYFDVGGEGLHTAVRKHIDQTAQAIQKLQAANRSGCFITMLHFSGHGAIRNGHTLLLGIDGWALDLEQALSKKNFFLCGLKVVCVVVLDTCRNDGLGSDCRVINSLDHDRAHYLDHRGIDWVILRSCDSGGASRERNDEGIFSSCFKARLGDWCFMDIHAIFTKVAKEVREGTHGFQRPWIESRCPYKLRLMHPSIVDECYFDHQTDFERDEPPRLARPLLSNDISIHQGRMSLQCCCAWLANVLLSLAASRS